MLAASLEYIALRDGGFAMAGSDACPVVAIDDTGCVVDPWFALEDPLPDGHSPLLGDSGTSLSIVAVVVLKEKGGSTDESETTYGPFQGCSGGETHNMDGQKSDNGCFRDMDSSCSSGAGDRTLSSQLNHHDNQDPKITPISQTTTGQGCIRGHWAHDSPTTYNLLDRHQQSLKRVDGVVSKEQQEQQRRQQQQHHQHHHQQKQQQQQQHPEQQKKAATCIFNWLDGAMSGRMMGAQERGGPEGLLEGLSVCEVSSRLDRDGHDITGSNWTDARDVLTAPRLGCEGEAVTRGFIPGGDEGEGLSISWDTSEEDCLGDSSGTRDGIYFKIVSSPEPNLDENSAFQYTPINSNSINHTVNPMKTSIQHCNCIVESSTTLEGDRMRHSSSSSSSIATRKFVTSTVASSSSVGGSASPTEAPAGSYYDSGLVGLDGTITNSTLDPFSKHAQFNSTGSPLFYRFSGPRSSAEGMEAPNLARTIPMSSPGGEPPPIASSFRVAGTGGSRTFNVAAATSSMNFAAVLFLLSCGGFRRKKRTDKYAPLDDFSSVMERKEVNPDGTAVAAQKENRPVLSRNTSQVSPVSSGATRHAHSVCSSDCTPPTAASGTTRGPPPKYLSRRTLALTNQPAAAVAPKKSPAGNCPPCNTGRSFLDRHGLAKVEPNLAVVRCSSCSRPRNIGSGEGEGQHRHRSPPPRYKSLVSKHFPKTSGVPPLSAQPKFNSFDSASGSTVAAEQIKGTGIAQLPSRAYSRSRRSTLAMRPGPPTFDSASGSTFAERKRDGASTPHLWETPPRSRGHAPNMISPLVKGDSASGSTFTAKNKDAGSVRSRSDRIAEFVGQCPQTNFTLTQRDRSSSSIFSDQNDIAGNISIWSQDTPRFGGQAPGMLSMQAKADSASSEISSGRNKDVGSAPYRFEHTPRLAWEAPEMLSTQTKLDCASNSTYTRHRNDMGSNPYQSERTAECGRQAPEMLSSLTKSVSGLSIFSTGQNKDAGSTPHPSEHTSALNGQHAEMLATLSTWEWGSSSTVLGPKKSEASNLQQSGRATRFSRKASNSLPTLTKWDSASDSIFTGQHKDAGSTPHRSEPSPSFIWRTPELKSELTGRGPTFSSRDLDAGSTPQQSGHIPGFGGQITDMPPTPTKSDSSPGSSLPIRTSNPSSPEEDDDSGSGTGSVTTSESEVSSESLSQTSGFDTSPDSSWDSRSPGRGHPSSIDIWSDSESSVWESSSSESVQFNSRFISPCLFPAGAHWGSDSSPIFDQSPERVGKPEEIRKLEKGDRLHAVPVGCRSTPASGCLPYGSFAGSVKDGGVRNAAAIPLRPFCVRSVNTSEPEVRSSIRGEGAAMSIPRIPAVARLDSALRSALLDDSRVPSFPSLEQSRYRSEKQRRLAEKNNSSPARGYVASSPKAASEKIKLSIKGFD